MAKTLDPKPPLDLQARLNRLLPNIRLLATPLPLVPELRLWLLDELVDERLDQEVANALMEAPPYWSLCWASGQVLARHLLAHQDQQRGHALRHARLRLLGAPSRWLPPALGRTVHGSHL